MVKIFIRVAGLAALIMSPAMAAKTTAYKVNKNMQKCEAKCQMMFKAPWYAAMWSNVPTASTTTCTEACMANPSTSTSQVPVDVMKYHVLDTYLWNKANGDPVKFQTSWNAFKAWMDNTYLKQCDQLRVVNRDFIHKVSKSYKSKKGKIICFSDIQQGYNKLTGTVGVLK